MHTYCFTIDCFPISAATSHLTLLLNSSLSTASISLVNYRPSIYACCPRIKIFSPSTICPMLTKAWSLNWKEDLVQMGNLNKKNKNIWIRINKTGLRVFYVRRIHKCTPTLRAGVHRLYIPWCWCTMLKFSSKNPIRNPRSWIFIPWSSAHCRVVTSFLFVFLSTFALNVYWQ